MTKRSKFNEWNTWETVSEESEYGMRPRKFRRNKIDGVFGGVCSGVGDYIGMDHLLVRIIFVLSVLFLGLPLFVYFLFWIFTPSDKRAPYRREYREERRARRENPGTPVRTSSFRDVKSKFRSLETRLQDLERSITSKEWQLNRQFRDLD